ncbi:MAG: hypothetical protein PF689_01975 [Deltaproteobacteria bacterium]|jgi:lipopolysaccharide biosynthesis regulator YciM|nr:hypothetical protein [Deltaproteobacteria bacterium]
MININRKKEINELLQLCDIVYKEKENLSFSEIFHGAFIHYHILKDGFSVKKFMENQDIAEGAHFFIRALIPDVSVDELEAVYQKRLKDLSDNKEEALCWLKIWLYLYRKPENVIDILKNKNIQTGNAELLLYSCMFTENQDKYGKLLEKGGVKESRFRSAVFTGDTLEQWDKAIKFLSKNDALETLTKLEYIYRAKADPAPFRATEKNLFSTLGESEFLDASLFINAYNGREEIAIEHLITLSERKDWAAALAVLTAIRIAASSGEDVILIRLYHKLYQLAQTDELKGAACLRAAQIAHFRLDRKEEAERFYKLAKKYEVRPFLVRRGLFDLLLERNGYGELVDYAVEYEDDFMHDAAALLAQYRLYNHELAWTLVSPSDTAAKIDLALHLGKWDEIFKLYSINISNTFNRLIISIYNSRLDKWDDAFANLRSLEKKLPLIHDYFSMHWYQQQGEIDKAIKYGESLKDNIKNKDNYFSILLYLSIMAKDNNHEKASVFIGEYLDLGGIIPAEDRTNITWFYSLMEHEDPKPEWFKEIEPQIDFLLKEKDKERDWPFVAKLLSIKRLIAKSKNEELKYLYRLAKINEEALKNIDDAVQYYTDILNIDNTHQKSLDSLGRIYETREDWDNYIKVLRLSLETTTEKGKKAALYFKYGSIMETQFKKNDQALKYYKLAVELSPTSLPAIHGIRDLYMKRGHWKGVLNTLKMEASVWDDPREMAGIYVQMGEILDRRFNKTKQAERYFNAALSLRPDSPGALRSLFQMYYKLKDWDKASEIAGSLSKKAISEGTTEERAELNYQRGKVFKKIGELFEAVNSFILSIRQNKSNYEPLREILEISSDYHAPEQFNDFIRQLEEIYDTEDNSTPSSFMSVIKAKLGLQNNDLEFAFNEFEKATEKDPCLHEAVLGKTELYLMMGEEEKAVESWKDYTKLCFSNKRNQTKFVSLAKFFSEKLDRPRDAMKLLRNVLQKKPNDMQCLFELASELLGSNKVREAAVTVERLLNLISQKLPPAVHNKYIVLAIMIKYKAGEKEKVGGLLKKLRLSDLTLHQGVCVSWVLAKMGNIGKSLNLLDRVKTSNAEDNESLITHKALLKYLAGNINGAMESMESLENLKSSRSQMFLADLYLQHKQKTKALEIFEKLYVKCFDDSVFLKHFESVLPASMKRRKRIFQVRTIFDKSEQLPPHPRPFIKNDAFASDDFRRLVGTKDPTGPVSQMWFALRTGLEEVFKTSDPALPNAREARGPEILAWDEVVATLGQEAHLWVTELQKKQMLITTQNDQIQIVVRPELFDLPMSTIRFILGRSLEAARSGYSLLFHINKLQRREVFEVMYSLALPPDQRDANAKRFYNNLGRREKRAVDRISSSVWEIFPDIDLWQWFESIDLAISKVGLLLCGDINGALRGLNYIQNHNSLDSPDPLVNFTLSQNTHSLISSYLSKEWDQYLQFPRETN